jgi:HD-GYP domain-containing protein (c-di-GMP phosphodiesterase class II)
MDTNEKIYRKLSIIANTMICTSNITSSQFLCNAFNAIFDLIPEAQKGSLFILDNDIYQPQNSRGYDFELLKKLSFTKDNIFIGFEIFNIHHIEAYENYVDKRIDEKFTPDMIDAFKKLGTYSNFVSIYAPIVYNSEPIGLLSLENFEKKEFSAYSKDILRIYAQIISNYYSISKKHEIEQELHTQTINALICAIELKDSYTLGHANRVMKLSCLIAHKMNLSAHTIERIKLAALFHDIGKIGIASDILNKPTKLSAKEFDMIKTHPEKATQILNKIDSFSDILDMVLHHHERFDGYGYPNGLRGEQIPLGAQIIMVADSYDAMTSERAYRAPLNHQDAIAELIAHSGTQYNPEVVSIVLGVLRESSWEAL